MRFPFKSSLLISIERTYNSRSVMFQNLTWKETNKRNHVFWQLYDKFLCCHFLWQHFCSSDFFQLQPFFIFEINCFCCVGSTYRNSGKKNLLRGFCFSRKQKNIKERNPAFFEVTLWTKPEVFYSLTGRFICRDCATSLFIICSSLTFQAGIISW